VQKKLPRTQEGREKGISIGTISTRVSGSRSSETRERASGETTPQKAYENGNFQHRIEGRPKVFSLSERDRGKERR